jgi:hypothetical protein
MEIQTAEDADSGLGVKLPEAGKPKTVSVRH